MVNSIVVKATNLSKSIKKQTLVEPINFTVAAGHVLALCGGNGAGKSTILRMITGIMQPSTGEIEVNGLQWKRDRKGFAKLIGYMPDDYQFSHGLTAWEALAFWGALRSVSKKRIEEVLERVGLADKRNNRVQTFSKGMRQRLLFAQAILDNPPLLIMDEPTNGLDPFWMNEFVRLINGVKEEGNCVIFSTHQLQIAEEIADHVIFLNQGRSYGYESLADYEAKYGAHPLHAAFQAVLT